LCSLPRGRALQERCRAGDACSGRPPVAKTYSPGAVSWSFGAFRASHCVLKGSGAGPADAMSRPWALSVSNGSGAPWAADWTVLVVVSQGGQPRREWRSYSCLGLAQSRRVGCASTACRVSVDLVLASPEEGGARHALIWQYGGWLREPPLGAGLHGERPRWVVLLLSSPHLEWVHTQCAVGFALTRSLRSDAEMKFCTPSVVHAVTNPRTGARTAAFPFFFGRHLDIFFSAQVSCAVGESVCSDQPPPPLT